jgi:superfamily I DNA/RNA helicase
VMRAHALLLGRDAVTEDDVMFLEHVLWKDPEERPKVIEAIRALVKGYEERAQELLFESRELREYAEGEWESEEQRMRALTEVNAKIARIATEFDKVIREATESGRSISNAERMRTEVREIQQTMLRRSLGA